MITCENMWKHMLSHDNMWKYMIKYVFCFLEVWIAGLAVWEFQTSIFGNSCVCSKQKNTVGPPCELCSCHEEALFQECGNEDSPHCCDWAESVRWRYDPCSSISESLLWFPMYPQDIRWPEDWSVQLFGRKVQWILETSARPNSGLLHVQANPCSGR